MVTDSTGELQQRVIGFIAENGPQLGKELALALPDVPVLALWQACYRSEAFHMSHFASYYLRFDVTRDDQVRLSPSILRATYISAHSRPCSIQIAVKVSDKAIRARRNCWG